jgi:hypothetical protein
MLRRIFIALIVFAAFGAMAQEEASLEIPLLLDGDVVEDFLSLDIQTRLYAFNGNEDDEVSISMTALDGARLDPMLLVFGPSGELLGLNDDANGLDSALTVELPETGTYFVFASSFELITTLMIDENTLPQGEMNFELSITGNSLVEGMEDTLVYVAGILEADEAFQAETSDEQAAWYFVFEGSEGDVVTLLAESENFDTVLHIFSPEGERIAVNDDYQFPDSTNSQIEALELPADGMYLVVVSDAWVMQGDTEDPSKSYYGDFSIELSFE